MNQNKLYWDRAKKVIPGGNSLLSKRGEMFLPEYWPTYFDSAKGISVKDLNGSTYKDFSHFGVGTNTLGYGNPVVDQAVISVVQKGNMSTLNPPEEVELAEKLVSMHPWSSMARFARTGGEANAMAVRIARNYTGKEVIAFCGYHGWHDWYLAANLKSENQLNEHLLTGLSAKGVASSLSGSVKPFLENDIDALKEILSHGNVAAIKMEVMRSNPPDVEYLSAVRNLASENGALLIFDECTSGFRETFGGLHLKFPVCPDLAVFGKALGNGYAITAVLGTESVMNESQRTFISSTFFTERIGFAAALATLGEMERQRSWEKISKTGKYYKQAVTAVFKEYSIPHTIAGMDALASYKVESEHWLEIKTYITQEMLKKGFLHSNLFYPSVCHEDPDIDHWSVSFREVIEGMSNIGFGSSLTNYLSGPVCHDSFRRLN